MTEVIPAILVDDFIELKEKLSQVVGLAKTVQIDICDGKFVKSTSSSVPRPTTPNSCARLVSYSNHKKSNKPANRM